MLCFVELGVGYESECRVSITVSSQIPHPSGLPTPLDGALVVALSPSRGAGGVGSRGKVGPGHSPCPLRRGILIYSMYGRFD